MYDAIAHASLSAAINAMGGRDRLTSIHAIDYTAVGERSMVEQSERPTGPFFIDHFKLHIVRDLDAKRERIESTDEAYAADHWWTTEEASGRWIVVNGTTSANDTDGKWSYGGRNDVQDSEERQALSPERVLLTADAASDLHASPRRDFARRETSCGHVSLERRSCHAVHQRGR